MALLEKLSGSCQGEKINVWPDSPGNWDQPPSTPHMQTRSHILRSSRIFPSSSPVIVHMLPVHEHLIQRTDGVRRITLLVFWYQVKDEDISFSPFSLQFDVIQRRSMASEVTHTWVHLFLVTLSAIEIFFSCIHLITRSPFFNEDPCCHQAPCPPVDTWQEGLFPLLPVCFLSFYLSTLSSISFSTHPSLWTSTLISRHPTIDVFDTEVCCVSLSLCLLLHLSVVSFPSLLSSYHISEIDLLFVPFSLVWVTPLNFLPNWCPLYLGDILQAP